MSGSVEMVTKTGHDEAHLVWGEKRASSKMVRNHRLPCNQMMNVIGHIIFLHVRCVSRMAGGCERKTHKRDAGSQQKDSDQEVFKLFHHQLPDALSCQTEIQEVMSSTGLKAYNVLS